MRSSTTQQRRKGERGVTIVLVAIALLALLAMGILAIDIVTLYVARVEAQRSADAAALAAAKVFVTSGFTSGQLGWPLDSTAEGIVCGAGASAANPVNQMATSVATCIPTATTCNLVAGSAPTLIQVTCNFPAGDPENPQVTVKVQQTNLPTFFARLFGNIGSTVTATATAEAYNPSGSGSTIPIGVAFVKPWLIPNCNPSNSAPPCTGGNANFFIDTGNGYIPNTANATIGHQFSFVQNPGTSPAIGQYYVLTQATESSVCPVCAGGGQDTVWNNTACASTVPLSCGAAGVTMVTPDQNTGTGGYQSDTVGGTDCFIHASAPGPVACTTPNTNDQDCFVTPAASGLAVTTINGGVLNLDTTLQGISNISRSDSVITVPVYDGLTNPCQSGTCNAVQIIGFLQLGIQDIQSNATIDAVVLNISGCSPNDSGTPVTGGATTPVPVRLITPSS